MKKVEEKLTKLAVGYCIYVDVDLGSSRPFEYCSESGNYGVIESCNLPGLAIKV